MSASPAGRNRRPRRDVAALLSFLWPGLGQWYAGRPRAAALFAIPVAVLLLVLLAAGLADPERAALRLLEPGFALLVLVVVLIAGAWRLASMADAGLRPSGGRAALRGRSRAGVVALAVVVIASHLGVAWVAWSFHELQQRIFVADPVGPRPSPTPAATSVPGATVPPPTPPGPTPTPGPPGRVNILLAGIDSGGNRRTMLTDTMMVVSLDPVTHDLAMVSFPRDIARFRLPDGSTFSGKLNALFAWATTHPDQFPEGPRAALTQTVSNLLGLDVDYYATINLEGFEQMIDAVGGVTVVNERPIDDPTYGGFDGPRTGFQLSVGRHHLDGETALAYVRSRKGTGDNDFTRARRQQQLLVAIADQLSDPANLPRLPAILDAAGGAIVTNFPPDRLFEMLELAREVDEERVRRVVLGPPYATHPPMSSTGGIYTLRLDLDAVAELSVKLFGSASRYEGSTGGVPTP